MDFTLQLISALAVLAAIGALALIARGKGLGGAAKSTGGGMLIERQMPLSHQHRLFVISVEGHRLLVATHPAGCTLIDRLDARDAGRHDTSLRNEAGA